jgi:hypothetical protein
MADLLIEDGICCRLVPNYLRLLQVRESIKKSHLSTGMDVSLQLAKELDYANTTDFGQLIYVISYAQVRVSVTRDILVFWFKFDVLGVRI